MKAIEIARRLADMNRPADAQEAYVLAIQENNEQNPAVELEAATYILSSGGKYEIAYTEFLSLYNRGHYHTELLGLMTEAFYKPNRKLQESQYEKNCKLLKNYSYLFRKDFLPFDELPIKFYPFDDEGFTPFYVEENRFGGYVNFNHPVISRNFFHDLENPILADDVFSQYELEYLNDNVRKSDWVARDNHIYLQYTDWAVFCAYLQVINFKELLRSEKFVFLIEDEISMYPIDFKERFGIDYSQNTVKPISVNEIHRLIWHAQFAAHNGGDFFNEIFYGHPNLLANQSIMFESVQENVDELKKAIRQASQTKTELVVGQNFNNRLLKPLTRMRNVTDKDAFVALFLGDLNCNKGMDPNARVAPAIFFQPHFPNMLYTLTTNRKNQAVLDSEQYKAIRESSIFRNFKYIKTFTPLRRITTSYAATVKFMYQRAEEATDKSGVVSDVMAERLLNRSYMINWQDRLYQDSVLVRFEDGKLNPKATFTALAAFLDLPYTESMTYCSGPDGLNPESMEGNVLGFDPASVYKTYDEYANDPERYFLEYFMRDAYEYYGYNYRYYDGESMDLDKVKELIDKFTTLNGYIKQTWQKAYKQSFQLTQEGETISAEQKDGIYEQLSSQQTQGHDARRLQIAQILMRGLNFINQEGQPLKMMKPLQLDPDLLEAPLYR